jgi:hypothetical protein
MVFFHCGDFYIHHKATQNYYTNDLCYLKILDKEELFNYGRHTGLPLQIFPLQDYFIVADFNVCPE